MKHNVIEFPQSPSARKPQSRCAPHSRNHVPAAYQGGIARTRPYRGITYGSIALGWIIAFAVLFMPVEAAYASAAMVLSAALFGFAVGWIAMGEVVGDGENH